MKYNDLRDFIDQLEKLGELKRISVEVDPHLEMTEICDRTLRAGGPALLFENPKGYDMPVLANLFGTTRRVALGMGQDDVTALRDIGKLLAYLKEPDPPKGFKDAIDKLPLFRKVVERPWTSRGDSSYDNRCSHWYTRTLSLLRDHKGRATTRSWPRQRGQSQG